MPSAPVTARTASSSSSASTAAVWPDARARFTCRPVDAGMGARAGALVVMMRSLIDERTVRDPAGREWTVGIRWLPRRPTWLGWGPGRNKDRAKHGDPTDLEW